MKVKISGVGIGAFANVVKLLGTNVIDLYNKNIFKGLQIFVKSGEFSRIRSTDWVRREFVRNEANRPILSLYFYRLLSIEII